MLEQRAKYADELEQQNHKLQKELRESKPLKNKVDDLEVQKAVLQEHLGLHEKGNGVGVEPQYPRCVEYWPELQNALDGQAETTSTLSSYESKNVCFRARGDAEPPYEDSLRVCKGEEKFELEDAHFTPTGCSDNPTTLCVRRL